MKKHLYIPIYSFTLLLSAALLFSVQPMFSKMILPLLGGTPQVWNTAMLFFQVMLLGGYAYAHLSSRYLNLKSQGLLHILILALCAIALPIAIPDSWTQADNHNPTLWQLGLMSISVGGPFFALAGSAPLFQKWFAHTDHKDADNPYFLYGASNLGSMSALLLYPFVIEPMATLQAQSHAWMIGYFALVVVVFACFSLVWRTQQSTPINPKTKDLKNTTWGVRTKWLALAFVPSSLMLGVTTYITSEVASMPLIWIIPLALYVGTFILVFARRPLINSNMVAQIFGLIVVLSLIYTITHGMRDLLLIPIHLTLFFFAAYSCHSELAALRPRAEKLTEFYLFMSIGGALGGFFNAIIAPVFFTIPLEYALTLCLAIVMRFTSEKSQSLKTELQTAIFRNAAFIAAGLAVIVFFAHSIALKILCASILFLCLNLIVHTRYIFAICCTIIIVLFPPGYFWGQNEFTAVHHMDRNFFGILKVVDNTNNQRAFLHGVTTHGTQTLDPDHRLELISYYARDGLMGDIFEFIDKKQGQQRIAVIGLGVGSSACYQRNDRHFDFYEINTKVIEVAENPDYFTFLRDCGSPYTTIVGDGRQTLQKQNDDLYDLIIIDAFSSDNIPAHLLTKEAVELYRSKAKPNTPIIFNISNNYLDLEPVLGNIAHDLQTAGLMHIHTGGKIKDTEIEYYPAAFFSMSGENEYVQHLKDQGWKNGRTDDVVGLWTDQFSNIISVIMPLSQARQKKEKRQD